MSSLIGVVVVKIPIVFVVKSPIVVAVKSPIVVAVKSPIVVAVKSLLAGTVAFGVYILVQRLKKTSYQVKNGKA